MVLYLNLTTEHAQCTVVLYRDKRASRFHTLIYTKH